METGFSVEIPQSLVDKGITQEQYDAFVYFTDQWRLEVMYDGIFWGMVIVAVLVLGCEAWKRWK